MKSSQNAFIIFFYSTLKIQCCMNPYKWDIQVFPPDFIVLNYHVTYSWFRSTEKGIIHRRSRKRDGKCSFFNFFWRICKLGKIEKIKMKKHEDIQIFRSRYCAINIEESVNTTSVSIFMLQYTVIIYKTYCTWSVVF